jgi:hypothetical protein
MMFAAVAVLCNENVGTSVKNSSSITSIVTPPLLCQPFTVLLTPVVIVDHHVLVRSILVLPSFLYFDTDEHSVV